MKTIDKIKGFAKNTMDFVRDLTQEDWYNTGALIIASIGAGLIYSHIDEKAKNSPIEISFIARNDVPAKYFNSKSIDSRPYIQTSNPNDTPKEIFSDNGNGNFTYIDSTGKQYHFSPKDSLPGFLAEKRKEFTEYLERYGGNQ